MAMTTNITRAKECKVSNNIIEGPEITFNTDYTSLGKLLLDRLKSDDNFVGQLDSVTGKEDTYKEMRDRSVRCALWMKKNAILPGDIIAGCSHVHLDIIIPSLASLYIGAISVHFHPKSSARELQHKLRITMPKMIFASEETASDLASAAKEVNLDLKIIVFGEVAGCETFSRIIGEQEVTEVESFECTEIENPDQTAMIFITSGTTGFPKAAALSHSTIMKCVKLSEILVIENQIMLVYFYLSCSVGVIFALTALTKNTKRIITPSELDENSACSVIEKFKAQFFVTCPSVINSMLKSENLEKYDITSLERVVVLGEPFSHESEEAFSKYFRNTIITVGYGMTEFSRFAAYHNGHHKIGSCGFVAENTKMKFIDPKTGKILGPNERGEICFKSDSMMTCYYGNPRATAEIIDKDGWLHSGDVGFYDEDGEVFVVCRMKEIINYRGDNICPTDIEAVLLSHPCVEESAVIGLPHDIDGEVPLAFVVTVPGSKITEKELIDLVAAELSDYKWLRGGVKFIDGLPTSNGIGKLKRKELQALAESFVKNKK